MKLLKRLGTRLESFGDACLERHERDVQKFQEWIFKGDKAQVQPESEVKRQRDSDSTDSAKREGMSHQ